MMIVLCEIMVIMLAVTVIKIIAPKTWLTAAIKGCILLFCFIATLIFVMDLPALIKGGEEKRVTVEYVTENMNSFTIVTSDGTTYWGQMDISLKLDDLRGKDVSLYVLPTSRFIYNISNEMLEEWAIGYSNDINSPYLCAFITGIIIFILIKAAKKR